MTVPYLQIDNLTKSFGDLVLFENISFGIAEGQRVGLIAKNGSGKTTLLNIIAGKEGYDSGSIVFRRDLRVDYLEQDPQYPEELTVLEACFRKGVLRKITEEGQIITTLTTTFPAIDITKPEIFPSLLFYYGMLTITATRGNYLVLSIPNNNVRKQYYEFLLEEYQDNRHINLNDLGLMYYEMAYEGHWRETMEFIAHAYKENSSVRSSIEGERN